MGKVPEEVSESTGAGKMYWFLEGTSALLVACLVVAGAVAARTGRLLPWLRSRTVRPELWGYGSMLLGVGLVPIVSYGKLDLFTGSPTVDTATAVTGMLLMVAGGYLQALSTRPAS